MTIKQYWNANNKGRVLLEFEFAEEFACWIQDEKVWVEEYGEGAFELQYIKTIDEFKALHKLLTGTKLKS